MSIVSSTAQQCGEWVIERHTDHLGKEYTRQWQRTGQDVHAMLSIHAAELETQLAQNEIDEILGNG